MIVVMDAADCRLIATCARDAEPAYVDAVMTELDPDAVEFGERGLTWADGYSLTDFRVIAGMEAPAHRALERIRTSVFGDTAAIGAARHQIFLEAQEFKRAIIAPIVAIPGDDRFILLERRAAREGAAIGETADTVFARGIAWRHFAADVDDAKKAVTTATAAATDAVDLAGQITSTIATVTAAAAALAT